MTSDDVDRVMLDIETLGVEPGAALLSIGAVRFTISGLGDTFYRSIDLESCTDVGLEIDGETLTWWLEQTGRARSVLKGGDPLDEVLHHYSDWHDGADEIWANSPSFDCEIVAHAYDVINVEPPWDFWEERCYRTLSNLSVAVKLDQVGTDHHALDDAKHQARVAARTLDRVHNEGLE